MITPRTLKGFRDHEPARAIPRERAIDRAKTVFRSFGFAPIDTPALEYSEVLLGKIDAGAEIQRQLYRFSDQGGRDVALRFDLTVPFARFAAQHVAAGMGLGTPFKRYHVGPVWRGENTQAGRYREFLQCDIDTIGTTSSGADAEVVLVVLQLLTALSVGAFTVRVNDRRILNGVLAALGAAERSGPVLRALDKLAKHGAAAVLAELQNGPAALDSAQAHALLDVVAPHSGVTEASLGGSGGGQRFTPGVGPKSTDGSFGSTDDEAEDVLARAEKVGGAEVAVGVAAVRAVLAVAAASGFATRPSGPHGPTGPGRVVVDLSIARGLDYYTGTVLETFLDDLPGIGSVMSGGRYDDLAGLYTKTPLPGVGASLGLDRLMDALEQLDKLGSTSTPAPVLFAQFGADDVPQLQVLAGRLRSAGINAEVFPDPKKLSDQLKYAERRGFAVAVLVGANERADGVVKIKDLSARTETTVPIEDLTEEVKRILK